MKLENKLNFFISSVALSLFISSVKNKNKELQNQIDISSELLNFSQNTILKNRNYGNLNIDIQQLINTILDFKFSSAYTYDSSINTLEFNSSIGFDNDKMFLQTMDFKKTFMEEHKRYSQFKFQIISSKDLSHFSKNSNLAKDEFLILKLPIFIENSIYGIYYFYDFKKTHTQKNFEKLETLYYNKIIDAIVGRILTENNNYLSQFDALTNLFNRTYFEQNFKIYQESSINSKENFSLILIDINKLKLINDKLGHLSGDFALKKFSEELNTFIDDSNILARYGGDEFVIIFKNSNYKEAEELIENFRKTFISKEYIYDNNIIPIRFSYGIASSPSESMILHILVKIADERMYKHKKILSIEEQNEFNF